MSMKADSEGKAYDDINVTPMVDLYLVLLLIFIIMTTAGLAGLEGQPAQGKRGDEPGQEKDPGDHRVQ
jgi:biopolymer transport protein ExbD